MAILLTSLLILLLIDVPIALTFGISSLLFLLSGPNIPLTVIPQTLYNSTESFTLLAVPLFILAGNLMDRGGLSKRIVDFASALVGFIKGGLAMVSVVSAMIFAGISGSANADTAAIGSILIPAMKNKNYNPSMAATVVAAAGSIGVIIPPSIPMVVYASIANVSVGAMFLGGVIPGILIGISLMILSYIIALKEDLPAENNLSLKNIWETGKDAILAMGMPLIVLGGLFGGIFTATEAAAVAVFYSFIVGFFVYKQIKLSDIYKICLDSAVTTGIPMLIVATTQVFTWIMAWERIPDMIAASLLSFTNSKVVMLLLFNIVELLLGTFLDALPAIVLSAPIVLPVAAKFGIDPVLIGVIMVVNQAIGMITPPVGVTWFVSCSIANIELSKTYKHLFIYMAAMLVVLLLITLIPDLVMYLPRILMK